MNQGFDGNTSAFEAFNKKKERNFKERSKAPIFLKNSFSKGDKSRTPTQFRRESIYSIPTYSKKTFQQKQTH